MGTSRISAISCRNILRDKQGDRGLIDLVHLRQGLEHLGGIELVDARGGERGQFEFNLAHFIMGETGVPPASFEKTHGAVW